MKIAVLGVAVLIADAGFEPLDLGGIEDSQYQEPGSALWNSTPEAGDATALAGRIRAGQATAADPLTAPFEKLRDHAPGDPGRPGRRTRASRHANRPARASRYSRVGEPAPALITRPRHKKPRQPPPTRSP
jgi:hypothetical protein